MSFVINVELNGCALHECIDSWVVQVPECKNTKSISTGVSCPQDGCKGSLVEHEPAEARSFWMQ